MLELGQLDKQHAAFDERKAKIFVVSGDDLELSQETQKLFPYLIVVADPEQAMIKTMEVVHKNAAAPGQDAAAPTTFLFRNGIVQWLFRPDRVTDRLSPESLASAIDAHK